MDTRPSAPTTLTPTGGSFQKSTDCVSTMVKDSQQNTCLAHLHQRPRCPNDHTPAGDNDAASTRGRWARPKTSSDSEGNATFHPTNFPTSSFWFKSDTQMNGNFQNHEGDLWTNHRGDQLQKESTTGSVRCGRSNRRNASHNTLRTCDVQHSSTQWAGNF